ncbi:MAG: radical SAM protein, partial [Patescibacteria group bacterium]
MMGKIVSKIKQNIFLHLIAKSMFSKTASKIFFQQLKRKLYHSLVEEGSKTDLKAVQLKKYQWITALLKQLLKNYNKGYISFFVAKRILETLGPNLSYEMMSKFKAPFVEKYKTDPPAFIVISPTQKCNLNCVGCYAASSSKTKISLDFDVFDRILKENHDIFGSRFVTISGGEPLLYQSKGKNLFD